MIVRVVKSSVLPAHNEPEVFKDLHTFNALCSAPISCKETIPPAIAPASVSNTRVHKSKGPTQALASHKSAPIVVKSVDLNPVSATAAGSEGAAHSLLEACPDADLVCIVTKGAPKFFKASSGLEV